MVRTDRSRDRGFALLIVLWACVLLAFIATGITANGRTDLQLAANIRDAAVAEAAADGAIEEAAFRLLTGDDAWPADDRPRIRSVPGATVSVRIENEGGKVNPNIASRELMRALLREVGLSAEASDALAGNIAEWRFPRTDGGPAMTGLGAPPSSRDDVALRYRAAGLGYEPPGTPFESLDELGLVLGMTPALLERLRPVLSVLVETEADPALASPLVRRALAAARTGPSPTARPEPPRAVTVVAEAVTPTGARATRRAGLRLDRTGKERAVTVATWDTVVPSDAPPSGRP